MNEYYLLRQSRDIVNPIKIEGDSIAHYPPAMMHQDFRGLESVKVAYIEYQKYQEIPDILAYPTYMVSDEIRRVLHMYDENISFKGVQVFPNRPKYIKEASKVYWVYDCVMENCLHKDSVRLPNGELKELILDKRKLRGRDIFRVQGTLDNKLVISLAVAESILRRNLYGVGLERLSVR